MANHLKGMEVQEELSGNYTPDTWKHFPTGGRSSSLFRVSDTLFQKIFEWDLKNQPQYVPNIDFSKKELWIRIVCYECLLRCESLIEGWNNQSCHKGDCVYDHKWYIKDKS